MDEFRARCVGKLQLPDNTTMDSDTRDPIVLLVKLSRRLAETQTACAPSLRIVHEIWITTILDILNLN